MEAPVLGNKHHAREGELIVMAGGTPEQFERWEALFQSLGKTVQYVGSLGSAAALKLALNQLIASLTASFGLSLKLVQKFDVDVDQFMSILRESALYAPQYDKKLQNFLNHTYDDPNFPTRHLLKDVDLMLQSSRSQQLETAALEGVRKIITNALEKGFTATDYSSLVEGIEHG